MKHWTKSQLESMYTMKVPPTTTMDDHPEQVLSYFWLTRMKTHHFLSDVVADKFGLVIL